MEPQKPGEKRSTDHRDVDYLFSLTYEELRRLARTVRQNDACVTLNPTALVHEAWIKLANGSNLDGLSPAEFKCIAARAMRQLLVEAARRRNARKRGGESAAFVTFDESSYCLARPDQFIALGAALEELDRLNHRQATVVECRFFAGLEVVEIAELLGVSEATVHRDWKAARAWLGRELRRAG